MKRAEHIRCVALELEFTSFPASIFPSTKTVEHEVVASWKRRLSGLISGSESALIRSCSPSLLPTFCLFSDIYVPFGSSTSVSIAGVWTSHFGCSCADRRANDHLKTVSLAGDKGPRRPCFARIPITTWRSFRNLSSPLTFCERPSLLHCVRLIYRLLYYRLFASAHSPRLRSNCFLALSG